MLSAESERKRMGVYLEDWDSCLGIRAEPSVSASAAVESNTTTCLPAADNLIPPPLRLRQHSRTKTTSSTSTSPPTPRSLHSPPLSPTPTVFVSLQYPEPRRPTPGNLSLHRYRESLSSRHSELATLPAARSLKRKPKALNLNSSCASRTPPSPPLTPSSISVYSEPSAGGLLSSPVRQNRTSISSLENPEPIPSPLHSFVPAGSSKSVSELNAITRPKTQNHRLNAFCKHIWQFPTRFFCHSRSATEVSPSSHHLQTTFHHRGVSFEILTPEKRQHSHSFSSMATPRPRAQTRVRSLSLDGQKYRTPSRTLFDDLETAHSSITSRFNGGANQALASSPNLGESGSPKSQASTSMSSSVDQGQLLDTPPRMQPLVPFTSDERAETPTLRETNMPTFASPESTSWSLAKSQRRSRQRKPAKLVKQQPRRRSNQDAGNSVPKSPPRSPPRFAVGNFLDQHQPSLHGARGRIDKPRTIENIIKARLNMFDTRLDHVRLPRLRQGEEAQVDPENERLVAEPVQQEGENRGTETDPPQGGIVDCPQSVAQADTEELAPPSLYCRGNGASSPNFSRPIPAGRWFTRRFSPFKPISRSSYNTAAQGEATALHRSPTDGNPSHEIRHENKRPSTKLSTYQSESVAREIERGLFQERSDSLLCDEEVIDFGPGSSQSSSTQHMSLYTGSSGIFPSPLRIPSTPSSHFPGQGTGNPFFQGGLGTRSLTTRRSEGSYGRNRASTRSALGKRAETFGSERIQEEDDIADRDWETVSGSQQFTRGVSFGQADTEGSLADYSSYGSLPNSNSAQTRPPLRASKIMGSLGTSHNTDDIRSTVQAGNFSHFWHKDPTSGQYVLLPNPNYRNSQITRLNAFSRPVPALIASTSRCPTPLPNPYQHPSPLTNVHTNPFRSTPPLLHGQGNESTVNNSKSTSHISKEKKHTSHRYGHYQRDSSIRESARASFHHWFSEFVAKDPAQQTSSTQASSALHHFNGNAYGPNALHADYLNHPALATSVADNNNSTHPLSVNLECHPSLRPLQETQQLPSHGDLPRENSAAPSRSLSTDCLLPTAPESAKQSPGSLYHSIRSVRERVLGSASKRKSLNNVLPLTVQESPSTRDAPAKRPASTGVLDRHIKRHGTGKSSIFSLSSSLRTPTIGRHTSTRQGPRSPTADDLLRERLEQMDPALLADFCQPSPTSRYTRALWEPQVPSVVSSYIPPPPQRAVIAHTHGNTTKREPEPPAEAHFDHHAFPDSPRLNRTRRETGNLMQQRRLGRRIIFCSLFAIPFGWIILAMIGFNSGMMDWLIRRLSDNKVQEFHTKEELLARRLTVALIVLLFLGSMTAVAVVVSK